MKSRRALIATLLVSFAIVAFIYPQLASAQEPDRDQNPSEDSIQVVETPITRTFRDLSGGIQSIVTVAAILAGGYLAWRNLHIFRAREPHVTIEHRLSHRLIGEDYVHISVTVTLHNSSRVHVEFRDGSFTLQQVAPVSNEDVEHLYAEVFVNEEEAYLQWPTLDDFRRPWDEEELVVEPGESEYQTYEFIVGRDIESVAISTYFFNSRVFGKIPDDIELKNAKRPKQRLLRWREVRGPMGWGRTSVYDVILRNVHPSSVANEGQTNYAT